MLSQLSLLDSQIAAQKVFLTVSRLPCSSVSQLTILVIVSIVGWNQKQAHCTEYTSYGLKRPCFPSLLLFLSFLSTRANFLLKPRIQPCFPSRFFYLFCPLEPRATAHVTEYTALLSLSSSFFYLLFPLQRAHGTEYRAFLFPPAFSIFFSTPTSAWYRV